MRVELDDITVAAGGHAVRFYEREDEFLHAVGRYLGAALREGGVAIAIATGPHLRMLEADLEAAGLDPIRRRQDGRLVILDAAAALSAFADDGVIDEARFHRVVGEAVREAARRGQPVRAYGEMVAVLWEEGHVLGAVELEKAWNALAREVEFTLLCGYNQATMRNPADADALEQVCQLHSSVLTAGPEDDGDRSAEFAPQREAPRDARRFVTDALRSWGQGEMLVQDAQLLVTELASNAVLHAQSPFSVRLRRRDDCVLVAVRDESAAPPVMRDPLPQATSGRGLRVVAALATDWGVAPDGRGKTVWAELRH